MAIIDLYQALVFYQDRRLTEALPLAESALEFFSQLAAGGKAILCQLLLARIHLDSGRPERASMSAGSALRSWTRRRHPALSYQA